MTLAVALQRYAMYPGGHPSLEPAADAVVRRAQRLHQDRYSLSFGVARHQLIVEGAATDPEHPVLRRLAEQFHERRLGGMSVSRGVQATEFGEALRRLTSEPEALSAGGVWGNDASDWPHIALHPLAFDGLALADNGAPSPGHSDAEVAIADLWASLARAAVSGHTGAEPDATPQSPEVIAREINRHHGSPEYDRAVVDSLMTIARALREASGAGGEAGRRQLLELIRDLRPEVLRRIAGMDGDMERRADLALAACALPVEAAMAILNASAGASGQTISHGLVRMLSKLAVHAETAPESLRPMAGEALRAQVGRLLENWSLDDPNPESHARVLQRLATGTSAPGSLTATGPSVENDDPLRVIQMSLETGAIGLPLDRAIDQTIDRGTVTDITALLARRPAGADDAVRAIVARLVEPSALIALLSREPLDIESLDSLLPSMALEGYEILLDTLALSGNRGTRRKLLDRLASAPIDLGPAIRARLEDERWYVQRNMLVLLERTRSIPDGVSIDDWTTHDDPRLRAEAVRVQLALPGEREMALRAALWDAEPRVIRVGLGALAGSCAPEFAHRVAHIALSAESDDDIRGLAAGVLGGVKTPAALDALIRLTDGGKTVFGRRRLAPRSPVLMAALRALAAGWSSDPRAADLLAIAAKSSDPELAEAARPVRR